MCGLPLESCFFAVFFLKLWINALKCALKLQCSKCRLLWFQNDQQLDCALDLMRRLPPQQIEKNLSDLIDLVSSCLIRSDASRWFYIKSKIRAPGWFSGWADDHMLCSGAGGAGSRPDLLPFPTCLPPSLSPPYEGKIFFKKKSDIQQLKLYSRSTRPSVVRG